jgi:hypothetical protein
MFKPDLADDFADVAVMALAAQARAGRLQAAWLLGTVAPFMATGRTRTVLEQVAAERRRQLAKGWTPEHDDGHSVDTLARNGALILNGSIGGWVDASRHTRREQLIIGAALAIAAIERLDREAARV